MKYITLIITAGLFANLSMNGAAAAAARSSEVAKTGAEIDPAALQTMWNAIDNNNATELNNFLVRMGREKAKAYVNSGIKGKKNSPLLEAIDREKISLFNILLAHGANPAQPIFPSSSYLPIHAAVNAESPYFVHALLSRNKSLVNAQDDDGDTPLMDAVKHVAPDKINRNINVIHVLLWYGADVSITDRKGNPPLSLAQGERGNRLIATFLGTYIAAHRATQLNASDFGKRMPHPMPKRIVGITHEYLNED